METSLRQPVKRLLQKVILQVVPGRVLVRRSVRVAALVQGFSKNLFGQRDLAAHRYPGDPAELGVRLDVPADGVAAAVPDGDEAGVGAGGARGSVRGGGDRAAELSLLRLPAVLRVRAVLAAGRQAPRQLRQLEEVRFLLQPPPLFKELGQEQLRVAQVVQDVPEEKAVSVEEEAALAVFWQRARGALGELGPQQRVWRRRESFKSGHVHLAAHVQLHDVRESVGLRHVFLWCPHRHSGQLGVSVYRNVYMVLCEGEENRGVNCSTESSEKRHGAAFRGFP